MPGQPLSKIKSDAKFTAGAEVFKAHPEMMLMAMQTIAAGAGIDYVFSYILTNFLHADPLTGMAMYAALSGGEGRKAVLKAAAQTRLSNSDFLLTDIVFNWTAPARKIRNDFAHHLWGYSEDVPDAVLLIDPKCMVGFDIGVRMANMEMQQSRKIIFPTAYDLSLIRVYRKRAIDDAFQIVAKASETLVILGLDLQLSDGGGISEDTRARLLREPVIGQQYAKRLVSEKSHTP